MRIVHREQIFCHRLTVSVAIARMSGDDIDGMSDVTQSNITVNGDVDVDVDSRHAAEGKISKSKQPYINGKTTIADILKARKDFRKTIEGAL